jgi:ankyrin repeat protein
MDPKGTIRSKSPLPEGIRSKSLLLGLPNELLSEVASHLKDLKDLNSLVRTSRFFHGMFNTDLYRRAVAAEAIVLDDIVGWVLSRYRLASLTLLLDNGLSINHTGRFNDPYSEEMMLHFLSRFNAQEGAVPLARLLIQRGADTNAKDVHSSTVLHGALIYGNCEIAELLLAHGADPNAVGLWGYTPLHFASRRNDARMVNLLIAHGADIEARSVGGDAPLNVSSRYGKHLAMEALLEHGADAGAHNDEGVTPLHQVSTHFVSEHHELAKSLLEHGAIVNATDENGETPLHWSIQYLWDTSSDRLFMARFLLENGADVNAISNDGLSPLQRALNGGCEGNGVALLLEHGADVRVLNEEQRRRLSRISRSTA